MAHIGTNSPTTGQAPARARMNYAPAGFDPAGDLPKGFAEFLLPLHREFTPRQRALVAKRAEALARAHRGDLPNHLPPFEATTGDWRIELPAWCQDQRNQMTGPGDDAELVVKMIAHRLRHGDAANIVDDAGAPIRHTPELITRLFDEELDRILRELPKMKDAGTPETFRQARIISEGMITRGEFDPV